LVWADAVRGGLAGFAATWLMDLVTTGLYEGQSPETTAHEMAARPNGKGAVENLVDRVEAASGRTFSDAQRSGLTQAIHYGLGLGPGVCTPCFAAGCRSWAPGAASSTAWCCGR
jgi:hypothetical protein